MSLGVLAPYTGSWPTVPAAAALGVARVLPARLPRRAAIPSGSALTSHYGCKARQEQQHGVGTAFSVARELILSCHVHVHYGEQEINLSLPLLLARPDGRTDGAVGERGGRGAGLPAGTPQNQWGERQRAGRKRETLFYFHSAQCSRRRGEGSRRHARKHDDDGVKV